MRTIGKILVILFLIGVITFTHYSAYLEGISRGQQGAGQYVYGICSGVFWAKGERKHTLPLYNSKFRCAKVFEI